MSDEIQPHPPSDAALAAAHNADPRLSCWFDGKPATHVAPRHSSGDLDIPAHWLPVCTTHADQWFFDTPEDERLPIFSLPMPPVDELAGDYDVSDPGAPGNDEPDERHGFEA